MPRLFVAVRPPEQVLDLLAALPRPAETGVRYTTRSQWHVTLRFLGHVDASSAMAALEAIDAPSGVEAGVGPQVSRLGRSVVVVPVAGLDELAAAVTTTTASVGEPPDPRGFTGHLTVARLRHRGACGVAGTPIAARFAVNEVQLVESRLEPGGASYEVVAVHPVCG